ncbi:MAG: hypothetical protein ACXWMV_04805 [Syntrophales bacterium]
MAGSAVATSVDEGSWYQGLTPKHWRVLWASFLGWIFDGYETFALIVAIGPILTTLLPPEARSQLGAYADRIAVSHRHGHGKRMEHGSDLDC